MTSDIEIRQLKTMAELADAVELQKIYWGEDSESLVGGHMMFSLVNYGGHVLGAYDNDRLIGVLIGFLGTDVAASPGRPAMANLLIASKRMIVLPEYRGKNVGYRLKLAQRDVAIRQGIRLVTWTFDPVLTPNAHLNIHKLGAVSTRYKENYFGADADHPTMRADRLIVEWWITQRRVEERVAGNSSELSLNQYLSADIPIVNRVEHPQTGFPVPFDEIVTPSQSLAMLETPLNFTAIQSENPALAEQWRLHIRATFQQLFRAGFIITDFLQEEYEGVRRGLYVFSYDGAVDVVRLN